MLKVIGFFSSFNELARVYGDRNAARAKVDSEPFRDIEKEFGGICAVLWAMIQDREACKRYGDKGQHICTPAMLAEESGYSLDKVEQSLLRLCLKGKLRATHGGTAVKAA